MNDEDLEEIKNKLGIKFRFKFTAKMVLSRRVLYHLKNPKEILRPPSFSYQVFMIQQNIWV